MMRMIAAVLGVVMAAGVLAAADGVVVKYEKSKLVVKVDGKDRSIVFVKGHPHVHGADGKELKLADYPKHLKAGVKVELEEEDGKVTEVLIKK
jgi:hypothetical protein